ncbi:hypothetical protein [Cognatilysobacter lacus]|uniref:hypothetical protein n=1 Tax=Cognatilysobacter lacus TaxID=1643323 RepID=UPI0016593206|nr:hypothetical protein [Lysobacter lacus]
MTKKMNLTPFFSFFCALGILPRVATADILSAALRVSCCDARVRVPKWNLTPFSEVV